MERSSYQRRLGVTVGLGMTALLLAALAIAACAPTAPETPTPGAPEVARSAWDPAALEAVMPGLVGWRVTGTGEGALVALTADESPTVVWEAPSGEGVSHVPLAIDPDGPRVLCAVSNDSAGTIGSLVELQADGAIEELPMPEGYEGVIGAVFAAGRPLVVVYHGTADTFVTAIGSYTDDGVWERFALVGELPEYQFIERIASVPGTDTVALVLKTPGGTGDRDDEALVLATVSGITLTSFTTAFRDDALVAATPLWGAQGVVYPRNPHVRSGSTVVDLTSVEWNGDRWVETTVVGDAAFATGIETGDVVAQGPGGVCWVRSAEEGPHGGGQVLLRLDPMAGSVETGVVDLDDIGWFVWLEPTK